MTDERSQGTCNALYETKTTVINRESENQMKYYSSVKENKIS
jgi:hypothetical protein